jgi:hypothetical protein
MYSPEGQYTDHVGTMDDVCHHVKVEAPEGDIGVFLCKVNPCPVGERDIIPRKLDESGSLTKPVQMRKVRPVQMRKVRPVQMRKVRPVQMRKVRPGSNAGDCRFRHGGSHASAHLIPD